MMWYSIAALTTFIDFFVMTNECARS